MRSFIKASILFLIFFAGTAQAAVWEATDVWTDQKEFEYQRWVQKFAHTDMWTKATLANGSPNPYYGIKTDCADTVYALRIIFAYENSLPWAIRNPNRPTTLLTNGLSKFDDIPLEGGKRIRAFLRMIFDVVSTHSIANDTYPVSIKNLRSGTLILTSKKNHHSWTIAEIYSNGNPRLVFNSTVGKQSGSMVQERQSWPNPYWVFEAEDVPLDPNNPAAGTKKKEVYYPGSYAGFRYWTPIEQLLSDVKQLPTYSEDQFYLDLKQWEKTIKRIYAKSNETPAEVMRRLLFDACADTKQRVEAVNEAEAYKVENGVQNQCLDATHYDEFSTPSRDKRLLDALMSARVYFEKIINTTGEKAFDTTTLAKITKIFPYIKYSARNESSFENQKYVTDANSLCIITIRNEKMDLAEIKRRIFRSYLSPNPNEDILGRWGFTNGVPSPLAASCPTNGDKYSPYDLDLAERQARERLN